MPDPSSGRAPRGRRDARVALSAAAADLATYAEAVVPTRGDEHTEPAEYARIARRVQTYALEFKVRAVLLMRSCGATWEDVADAFAIRGPDGVEPAAIAEGIFGDAWQRWENGEAAAFHPAWMAEGTLPRAVEGDTDAIAAELDQWYARRTATYDPEPVTGSLPLL